MAKPKPGEKCPGCGGTMSPDAHPRQLANPHSGTAWFRHCDGASRLVPVQRFVPGMGLRTVAFNRREQTCTWIDPDLTVHQEKYLAREVARSERTIVARARASEGRARNPNPVPPAHTPAGGRP